MCVVQLRQYAKRDAQEREVAIRKILKDQEPLLTVLERWDRSRNALTPEQLGALFDDRARRLDILEDVIRVNALPVTLQAAGMRKRLTSATLRSSSCKLHRRSSSQHRARDARCSLFRYSHFLPASATSLPFTEVLSDMQPISRTSSKPKNKLSVADEPTMLLEVTPSLLELLGIGKRHLVIDGSVSYAPAKGADHSIRILKVVRLKRQSIATAIAAVQPAKPTKAQESQEQMLSAQAMADLMQCSRNNVYDQESRGRLFSVVPPGRTNGRAFPAFQLESTLDRELLYKLIGAYAERQVPMNLLWDFLRSAHEAFGGLTGVQVLTRKMTGPTASTRRAQAIANMSDSERGEFVVDVALEDLSQTFL